MADIKNRISLLKSDGFFKEMQTVTTDDGALAIYVIVTFPDRWIIDEEVEEKFGVTVTKSGRDFWFCTDMDSGFDTVFDAIEYNIERMRTAEERAKLLKIKITELRDLFEDESITLEALRTLEFTFSQPRKKRGPKTQTKQEEETIDNNEDNVMEG